MKRILFVVGISLALVFGVSGCGETADDRIQKLEAENAGLKGKLDNIQDLVTRAMSDLDDVQTEAQSEEACEDTNAYSYARDVEDKLDEIDSETSH
jgi:hypothetical protein